MRKSGNIEEAEFVKLVREWFEAKEDKGIGSSERAKRIMDNFIQRLAFVHRVNMCKTFDIIPPV